MHPTTAAPVLSAEGKREAFERWWNNEIKAGNPIYRYPADKAAWIAYAAGLAARDAERAPIERQPKIRKCLSCDRLKHELDEVRAALDKVLASAYPNAKEHPTMYAAWSEAARLRKEGKG
jgi:hypothetical protein